MRQMSFAYTTAQVRARTKTVTRRIGWEMLKAGEVLQPVVKAQGIKKGEHVEPLGGPIRVVHVSRQQLRDITPQDVFREGFPQMTREQFIAMFKRMHRRCYVTTKVTRIEFDYIDAPNGADAR